MQLIAVQTTLDRNADALVQRRSPRRCQPRHPPQYTVAECSLTYMSKVCCISIWLIVASINFRAASGLSSVRPTAANEAVGSAKDKSSLPRPRPNTAQDQVRLLPRDVASSSKCQLTRNHRLRSVGISFALRALTRQYAYSTAIGKHPIPSAPQIATVSAYGRSGRRGALSG